MTEFTGHCLCGAVTWVAQGPKKRNLICHCESCKRATGSPVTAFIGFERAQVTWAGQINHFQSSPGNWRGFCPDCGTRLYFKSDKWPDEVHIHATTLSDPSQFAPDQHVLWDEHEPWIETMFELPKSGGFGARPQED